VLGCVRNFRQPFAHPQWINNILIQPYTFVKQVVVVLGCVRNFRQPFAHPQWINIILIQPYICETSGLLCMSAGNDTDNLALILHVEHHTASASIHFVKPVHVCCALGVRKPLRQPFTPSAFTVDQYQHKHTHSVKQVVCYA
jgi:hypothetical protein